MWTNEDQRLLDELNKKYLMHKNDRAALSVLIGTRALTTGGSIIDFLVDHADEMTKALAPFVTPKSEKRAFTKNVDDELTELTPDVLAMMRREIIPPCDTLNARVMERGRIVEALIKERESRILNSVPWRILDSAISIIRSLPHDN